MKAKDAMIVWTPSGNASYPTAGKVEVLDVGEGNESRKYACWNGRGDGRWARAEPLQRLKMMFSIFHKDIVLSGKLDFAVAHKAFLKIDEYADVMNSLQSHGQLLAEREKQVEAMALQGRETKGPPKGANAKKKRSAIKVRQRPSEKPYR